MMLEARHAVGGEADFIPAADPSEVRTPSLSVGMYRHYTQYLDPAIPLEERVKSAFDEFGVSAERRADVQALLAPLKVKHYPTYEHCLRVGLLARDIAATVHLDQKALLYSGLLHDVGKALCPVELLNKSSGWSDADREIMEHHVMDGYRLLKGKFDFCAEVILWHHRFQEAGYPARLPEPMHDYSEETRELIPLYGRLLAMADTFDALHRINDRNGSSGTLSGIEIMERMLKYNPDKQELVAQLFKDGVFTTFISDEGEKETPTLPALPEGCNLSELSAGFE